MPDWQPEQSHQGMPPSTEGRQVQNGNFLLGSLVAFPQLTGLNMEGGQLQNILNLQNGTGAANSTYPNRTVNSRNKDENGHHGTQYFPGSAMHGPDLSSQLALTLLQMQMQGQVQYGTNLGSSVNPQLV